MRIAQNRGTSKPHITEEDFYFENNQFTLEHKDKLLSTNDIIRTSSEGSYIPPKIAL